MVPAPGLGPGSPDRWAHATPTDPPRHMERSAVPRRISTGEGAQGRLWASVESPVAGEEPESLLAVGVRPASLPAGACSPSAACWPARWQGRRARRTADPSLAGRALHDLPPFRTGRTTNNWVLTVFGVDQAPASFRQQHHFQQDPETVCTSTSRKLPQTSRAEFPVATAPSMEKPPKVSRWAGLQLAAGGSRGRRVWSSASSQVIRWVYRSMRRRPRVAAGSAQFRRRAIPLWRCSPWRTVEGGQLKPKNVHPGEPALRKGSQPQDRCSPGCPRMQFQFGPAVRTVPTSRSGVFSAVSEDHAVAKERPAVSLRTVAGGSQPASASCLACVAGFSCKPAPGCS